jgi:predicted dehydrogenase
MPRKLNRREFVRGSAQAGLIGLGLGFWSGSLAAKCTSPNEKLNVAFVGTANQARFSINGLQSEYAVAMCDVDDNNLDKAIADFPQARRFNDFRKMLDAMHREIDAVVVATPDHIHAPASMMTIKLGKHVYCEKPLTHTVYEARALAEAASKRKVATQMGTQIHATSNYRRVVELIHADAIGKVHEVHTWAGRSWGGGDRPTDMPPVPAHIHWDEWLGPAPDRPYHPTYLPQNWRKWWDFGGGNIADMACHHMDLPFWALGLRHPTTIEAEGPTLHPETCPLGLIVHYEFPARGDNPPVTLHWYDGDRIPHEIHGIRTGGGGNIFVGDKGMLRADYDSRKLYPESDFAGFKPPAPSIPDSIGHHQEWVQACKTGSATTCNFDYSGALSEAVLLGNVAYRTGTKIEWDPKKLVATNCPDADRFLRREYRKGWTL